VLQPAPAALQAARQQRLLLLQLMQLLLRLLQLLLAGAER
jgi:hypothetical protein